MTDPNGAQKGEIPLRSRVSDNAQFLLRLEGCHTVNRLNHQIRLTNVDIRTTELSDVSVSPGCIGDYSDDRV